MQTSLEQITFSSGTVLRESISAREVATMICDGLVIFENGPVFAIAGNAADPDLQAKIQAVKGEARGDAPVGATMPFDDPLVVGIFKTRHMTNTGDTSIRDFLEDPDAQTDRFGGLSFLRGSADLEKQQQKEIPFSIIPPTVDGETESTVQVYSPVGNTKAEAVIRSVRDQDGISVMTSANRTGTPEIIYESQIYAFAESSGLPLIICRDETIKGDKPRSSYPISNVTYNQGLARWELDIIRTGCFSVDILLALHEGVAHKRITEPVTKHPDNVLHMRDLPKQAWAKSGVELRKWVLEAAKLDR